MCKHVQKRHGALQAEEDSQVQDLFVCGFSLLGYNSKAMFMNSCITTEVNTCLQQMLKMMIMYVHQSIEMETIL